MEPGLDGGDAFDVIDVVVDLGLAAVAIAFSGVLFLNSRRRVVVRGRTIRHSRLWALTSALVGVVLVLRAGSAITPPAGRGFVVAATLLAAAVAAVATIVAIVRSLRS
jgi:hypothetical protein